MPCVSSDTLARGDPRTAARSRKDSARMLTRHASRQLPVSSLHFRFQQWPTHTDAHAVSPDITKSSQHMSPSRLMLLLMLVSNRPTPFTRYNRLLNRLYNRFDNRLYTRYSRLSNRLSNGYDNRLNVCIHDRTGCQTGLTTGLTTRLTTGCIV